jgi:hypothetical protein
VFGQCILGGTDCYCCQVFGQCILGGTDCYCCQVFGQCIIDSFCVPCPRGQYNPATAKSNCEDCEVGHYAK